MNLLVDNQLPAAFAAGGQPVAGGVCAVVGRSRDRVSSCVGPWHGTSDDREIWEFARNEHWVIVTKDSDFG
ncbi:MAG: DUF5615 family PIN-like protein [Thiohalocapsa sp. PB-PSB1]|nr:MAG: hypothetical protein N838_06895 [Thiohalocapsa sp. PB-PSB1]QQO53291.1 MAG: DUF5615 family PIN-like protein [Thiohalocapsa sp. PB-PSB1]